MAMESIGKILTGEQVQTEISCSNQNQKSARCWRCFGVGVVLITLGGQVVAKNCLCVKRDVAKAQLRIIPPAFGKPRLATLRPRPDLHQNQEKAIEFVRANPDQSYLFVGRNGTGKTHLAWALYRHAIANRRAAIACRLRDLIADFRRVEIGVPEDGIAKARVTADDLRKPGKPWLLFFDEFEKARPTEFASEQLFGMLDAACSFKHQIVITSNLSAEGLQHHWGRIDEVWGNSIMTRLQ